MEFTSGIKMWPRHRGAAACCTWGVAQPHPPGDGEQAQGPLNLRTLLSS